jgi:uncharacterized cupin superfamily protein
MSSEAVRKVSDETASQIEIGSRHFNPANWVPFEWDDPVYGPQVKGEVAVIRNKGTSGTLLAGLWRTGKGIAGCEADGSCPVDYSAPLGDETIVILEGNVTVTIAATGKKYRLEAGTMLSQVKGVSYHWDIESPFLKKFWVLWDCPNPTKREADFYYGNISDNPDTWEPFKWVEPGHGTQTCGERLALRSTGSTGTLKAGLWRTGVGIVGCKPDGSSTVQYSAPAGDETMILLEGRVHMVNEATGDEYDFKAGDIIALPSGLKVTWTAKAPFAKAFFVTTNEKVS